MQLGALHCQLWDTRGFDEVVDNPGRQFMAKIVDRIRQLASQQERELKETLRNRTRTAKPILMWCIDATGIDVPFQWQQFRKVYVEYCDRKAIPVVVVTRMALNMTGWELRCRNQLQLLGLGTGSDNTDVLLLGVRKHRNPSSAGYAEDSEALRDLISRLSMIQNHDSVEPEPEPVNVDVDSHPDSTKPVNIDVDACSSLLIDLIFVI